MSKKIIILILIIVILGICIYLYMNKNNQNNAEENTLNVIDNQTELSAELVNDECINEWEDYAADVQEDLKNVSSNLNDENREYILIGEDDVIKVYYINENSEKILYRVTDISLEYLPEEDRQKLEEGIEVIGIEELNNQLEDYE